jgi:hypothetical protein
MMQCENKYYIMLCLGLKTDERSPEFIFVVMLSSKYVTE